MDVSDSAIAAAYEDVRDDTTETNWLVLGHKSKSVLELRATGTDGLAGLKAQLTDDQVMYGFLRIVIEDDQSVRAKFAFISWAGTSTSVMSRAKVSVHKSFVKKVLRQASIDLHADDKVDLDLDGVILPAIRSAMGADYSTNTT